MKKERQYQLLMKPNGTASGEPPRWSFVAHGATYTKAEADDTCSRLEERGYATKRLPI